MLANFGVQNKDRFLKEFSSFENVEDAIQDVSLRILTIKPEIEEKDYYNYWRRAIKNKLINAKKTNQTQQLNIE